MNNTEQLKPTYDIDEIGKEYKIIYGDRIYILNNRLFCRILNFERSFRIHNINDNYPSYKINNKYIDFLEFAYELKTENYNFKFINGNKYDIRYDNIIIEDKSFKELLKPFNVISYIYNGTRVKEGRYSGQYKNPICKILNDKNEEEYLMLCNRNEICKLCPRSYEVIRQFEKKKNYERPIIWSYHDTGYILGNNKLFIHQVIKDCYGNGKGTKEISIDHIDQNPLNNRYDNLRIATREEQQENSKGIKEGTKRNRKHNARDLPEGITQDMMKKYVVYYKECYNKEKDLWREFFKVEKHPKLDKPWIGSKSSKVSILDKLKEANKIVEDLDNDTYEKKESEYPKNINKLYDKERENYYLCYDKRDKKKKLNCKMVLPKEYDLEEQLNKFEDRIRKKYPEYLTNIN